ncbi:MAG: hypothetical protein ACXU86_00460, partial [Archangium sp.]
MRTLPTLCLTVGTLTLSACALFGKEKTSAPQQTCAPETLALMKRLGVQPGQRGSMTLEANQ